MIKILQIGDPILEKKSELVKDPKSIESQELISDLVSICKKREKTTGGLAAPQIGRSLRKFVVRRTDIDEEYRKKKKEIPEELNKRLWEVMINPKILKLGKKKSTYWEGCLSIEEGKIFGPVTRPSFIKVKYHDRYGNKKIISAVDFFAQLIQHEIDHLNGTLFVKHVKNPENLWKSKDLDDYIKKHGEFPEIV